MSVKALGRFCLVRSVRKLMNLVMFILYLALLVLSPVRFDAHPGPPQST
jgi:hypothetical protein